MNENQQTSIYLGVEAFSPMDVLNGVQEVESSNLSGPSGLKPFVLTSLRGERVRIRMIWVSCLDLASHEIGWYRPIMAPRNIAFAPGSQTPFLEQSEEKWHSIEPSALGIPADITKVAEDLWQRQHEGKLSDEDLWTQGRALGLQVLGVLGDGFNFHVFVGPSIRQVATPSDRKDSDELAEGQLEDLSGGRKTYHL